MYKLDWNRPLVSQHFNTSVYCVNQKTKAGSILPFVNAEDFLVYLDFAAKSKPWGLRLSITCIFSGHIFLSFSFIVASPVLLTIKTNSSPVQMKNQLPEIFNVTYCGLPAIIKNLHLQHSPPYCQQ